MSDDKSKFEIEETVVVRVTLLGMSDEGMGTRTFSIDLSSDFMKGAGDMQKAFLGALADAMMDVQPAFQKYTAQKYKDLGNPGVDTDGNS